MKVKSKPGTKCPKEGKPRQYIEDSEIVEVPDTAYYKRLVRDGSLIEERQKAQRQKAEVKKEKPKAQRK
jgi:hypothetical protein